MAEKQIFDTVLEKHEGTEATGIKIPFDVERVFGKKRVPVKVWINEAQYRTTIFRMDGKFRLLIPKVFRDAAGIKAGETITVAMEKDLEKRTIELPEDFAAALKKEDLTDVFAKMSYTHQKEYVNSITEAKKAETRTRRIEKTIEILKNR